MNTEVRRREVKPDTLQRIADENVAAIKAQTAVAKEEVSDTKVAVGAGLKAKTAAIAKANPLMSSFAKSKPKEQMQAKQPEKAIKDEDSMSTKCFCKLLEADFG